MPLKNLPYLFALLSVIAAAQSYRTQDWTWQERAVLAVFVALTAALPPLLSGRSGRRWWVRSCLVSAHRLMAFTVPMEASAALSQLQLQPTTGGLGAVVDAIHLLIGERGRRTAAKWPCIPTVVPCRRPQAPVSACWPLDCSCCIQWHRRPCLHSLAPHCRLSGPAASAVWHRTASGPPLPPSRAHPVPRNQPGIAAAGLHTTGRAEAWRSSILKAPCLPAGLPACLPARMPATLLAAFCLACLRPCRQHIPHLPACNPRLPPFPRRSSWTAR